MILIPFSYRAATRCLAGCAGLLSPTARRSFPATSVSDAPRRPAAALPRHAVAAMIVALLTMSLHADVIPASRLTDWSAGVTVGVPGGIDQYLPGGVNARINLIDVTQAPYRADNTGSTDARPAIQAAINAAKAHDVVYLPAGRFRIDAPIHIGYTRSNITLRGAGEATIIDCRTANNGIMVGTSFEFNWPSNGGVVIAPSSLVKGATQLTVDDTSAFSVGQMILIDLANDPGIPVVSVVGYDLRPSEKQWQGMRRQITRITGKTSKTLSIFPGLYGDYTGAPHARVRTSQFHTTGVGVEDLFIDCYNGKTIFPVAFSNAYGCWASNVKVQYSNNYGIHISRSLNCEIRHCWIDQAKGQGSTSHCGILVDTGVGCLIEDNVIVRNFPSMMINHGSSGNVIAYNFCYDSTANGASGVSINTNHGPHNSYNLYEGNVAPNVQSDGYFGSASHDMIFRNWLHGMQPGLSKAAWTVSLNRFTRYYTLVGNILGNASWPAEGVSLGNPNMGNGSYSGEGPPWSATWTYGAGSLSQNGNKITISTAVFTPNHVGWFLHTPSSGTLAAIAGYIDPHNVTVTTSRNLSDAMYIFSPGPPGYQELDRDVAATLLRAGNFNYRDNTIPAAEALEGTILPDSLYRTTAPAWFGTLRWPPIDSTAPNTGYDIIPAGYRFLHEKEAPGIESPPPPSIIQPPTRVRIHFDDP